MPENATYISQLTPTTPAGTAPIAEGDDELRQLKSVLQNTFPAASQPWTISNRLAIAMADTGYILNADEARYDLIQFSGTLTANRLITFPTRQKLYLVTNNTSGGWNLLLRVGTGAELTLPPGVSLLVANNGTNIVDLGLAHRDFANNFTKGQTIQQALTIESSDAGATLDPQLNLLRSSPSPAAGDGLCAVRFQGKTSTGGQTSYGVISGEIEDPTAGSEDGKLTLYTARAGAIVIRATVGSGLFMQGMADPGMGKISADRFVAGRSAGLGVVSSVDVQANGGSRYGIVVENASGTTDTRAMQFQNSAGTVIGAIAMNQTSTAYNTSSDYRLKENVVPLADAADRIKKIPTHRFNFIGDPLTVDGFLAHEVQPIVPEAITGTKDEVDAEGKPVYQAIDQSKLVPLLTAALQDALARIESLEARMTAAGL